MFGGRTRRILRHYQNLSTPLKLLSTCEINGGIWTATGSASYNCNLPPAVVRRGEGHEKNQWRGGESCHLSWHGLKNMGVGVVLVKNKHQPVLFKLFIR